MSLPADYRTHHVGVLVKDIDAAIESYTKYLGYEVRTGIFHDPIQKAKVRFLALPEEAAYLELIAPDGPESHLMTALRRGGGVHHICYAVSGIGTAIAQLQENGFLIVRSPQPAIAFNGRAIAWLMNRDHLLIELVEKGAEGEL